MLLYSARFSRRSVTRPGSRSPPTHVTFKSVVSTRVRNAAFSAAGGCGLDFGGISPLSTTRNTVFQVLRSFRASATDLYTSSGTPPAALSELWHLLQYWSKKAFDLSANALSAAGLAAGSA